MGNISKQNYVKNCMICKADSSFGIQTAMYPHTNMKLFPLTGKDSKSYIVGNNTITLTNNRVTNGFRMYSPDYILNYLNVSPNASRVFNQKIYPANFFSFTNSEDYVGLSASTITLDLSGFNYNNGEDWSTQTKVYIMKITNTGVNGTGEFVLRSFPLIENNDDYLTASGQSLYSESLPVYINTSNNICFYGSNTGSLCDYTSVTGLWGESRRKDPSIYDDFVCLLLEDANTLNIYDFHSPFLPTKEKTITLANNTQQCTWITDYIYVLEDGLELAKITKSTEARAAITSTITTEDKVLVAHPDQDYVYLIGESEQQVIDISDDSVTTTTHDLSAYTDLMPVFDEDGNVWIGKYKLDKEDLSLLYTHTTEAFCNYNFIVDDNDEYFDLDGVSLDNGNYPSGAYSSTISITINEGTTVTYDTGVSLEEGKHNLNWEADSEAGGGGSTSVHMYAIFENNTTGEMFKYEDYSYFGSWSTRGIDACFLSKGVYTIKFQNAGSYWEKIRNLSVNSTPIDTDFLAFTTLDNVIKRHPQTWLFPYNTTDITQMYNQYTWFDSTGSEYDGENNAYEIPASGEVTIEDGIKVIVDDNDGYNQVVKDDYFYFVVSGRGLVLDNWTDANIKIALNAWNYVKYTKNIVLSDTAYTIEEAGLSNFIELNTLVISGNWNDSSAIIFTTSTPAEGEIQVNSNGTMTFNTNDIGRIATITYNVGYGV